MGRTCGANRLATGGPNTRGQHSQVVQLPTCAACIVFPVAHDACVHVCSLPRSPCSSWSTRQDQRAPQPRLLPCCTYWAPRVRERPARPSCSLRGVPGVRASQLRVRVFVWVGERQSTTQRVPNSAGTPCYLMQMTITNSAECTYCQSRLVPSEPPTRTHPCANAAPAGYPLMGW